MSQHARIEREAQRLLGVHAGGAPVPALHEEGELELADAYAVQRRVFGELHGSSPAGYKVSLVAPEHRAAFGASEPTCGRLGESQLVPSGRTIAMSSLFHPLVEPELVFRVRRDLSPNASADEVRESCDVMAGMEIPDSRWRGWSPVPGQTVGDLVADASFAGRVVHAEVGVPAASLDLSAVVGELRHDGVVIGTGRGDAVMGDPVLAVAWLSGMVARGGEILRAGVLVASGTFFYPPSAEPGTYTASYTGIGHASVTFA
ncbi:hypothetical protein [Aeromicrobium sp.]|uniref:2-keto-4-pentenoate hydratase n=1 Tax=Aeromicrobium sp. TaxID=1871063 RepID=UPI0025B817F7|nr:hypothetical protein [Aeromicrobium sp.]MCK5892583.1 hypothetical protein [Aeromicrobium sp.]